MTGMVLPDDIEISERSRKFYDGTYTLTSDGFTDEAGEYRAFDCFDPDARAPTPLPPMHLEDPIDNEDDAHSRQSMSAVRDSNQLSHGPGRISVTSYSTNKTSITIGHDGFFRDSENRERHLGRIEGIQIASRHAGAELSLAECYKLCEIAYPGERLKTSKTGPQQDNTRPHHAGIVESNDDGSPLSDCPSDLSEWEMGKMTTKSSTAKSEVEVHEAQPRPKRTTRGIARKVPKATKKPSAAALRVGNSGS